MSTDLGLDPTDPLSLLLQNPAPSSADSSMEDSGSSTSDGSSPQDWTQLSTLWDGGDPTGGLKYPELMDFNDLSSLPMDMDFNPGLGLDASSLHYESLKYGGYAYDPTSAFNNLPGELVPGQFAFTFQSALNASASSFSSGESSSGSSDGGKERRLSITSSSSSSGASLSPIPDSSPSPPSGAPSPQPTTPKVQVKKQEGSPAPLDPAFELADSVRQSAGVMLAVPMSTQLASQALTQALEASTSNPMQSKVPIPRLPRPSGSPQSSSSSAASTPPPPTPPMSSALPSKLTVNTKPLSSASTSSSISSSALPTPTTAVPTASGGARPKTSHTTIERRYRTNLNARIQSLRMAVPALRVLEDRDGGNGKKIKKNLKDGVYVKGTGIGIDGEDGTVDVIDERGFVDGVKVARKCSKANVLGKAVEYIRVLKKREVRLKAEQNGLKALVCGLVGGPALLKEWEQRWRERFGGEEKDEVEGDEAEDYDSDDEDGDDGEEEVGKKRKRAKTSAANSGVLPFKKAADKKAAMSAVPPPSVANVITQLGGTAPGAPAVPEKRKRGRPRKVPVPPAPVATLMPHVPQQQQQPAPMQDVVMQQHDQMMMAPNVEQQQQAHGQPQQYLLAVFALFSFFNSPLTSSFGSSSASHQHTGVILNPPLALAPEIVSQFAPPSAPVQSSQLLLLSFSWRECAQVLHLVVSVLVLGSLVCGWMGLSLRKKSAKSSELTKRTADGKVDWASVCHDTVLNKDESESLSTSDSVQMYSTLLSSKTPSIPQLTSVALSLSRRGGLLNGLARARARSLWNTAKLQTESLSLAPNRRGLKAPVRLSEKLVLEKWDLDEALNQLGSSSSSKERANGGETLRTPIEVLASILVRQRVKQHLGQLFVEAVGDSSATTATGDEDHGKDKEKEKNVEVEMRRTIDAARELGGAVEELGRTLERVWKSSVLDDIPIGVQNEEEETDEGATDDNSDNTDKNQSSQLDGEIKALLTGLVLYRRLFAVPKGVSVTSVLLSPPPSPTSRSQASKEGNLFLDLRKALGSRVFEDGDREGEMEDARDRVVDLIVEMERRGRSSSP